jgi:hypothetical protein
MKRCARGFAIINAILLIIVLGALGAAAVTLSKSEADTGAKSLLSARSYYGAKAGLEWGIQQAVAAGACTGGAGVSFNLADANLAGVAVTVICTSSVHGAGNIVYYITSQANTGALGNVNYAERNMEATVSAGF